MHDYVDKNSIYLHANEVFIPNGIDIKKVYTYKDKLYSVKDMYKKIISEKSPTIAGYKFTIKSTTFSSFIFQIANTFMYMLIYAIRTYTHLIFWMGKRQYTFTFTSYSSFTKITALFIT